MDCQPEILEGVYWVCGFVIAGSWAFVEWLRH